MTPEGASALQQLHPDRREIDPARAYGALRLGVLAPSDRPYVVANMIMSADGRATLDGRTEGLSSRTDRELMFTLRTQVDAVMAGPATIAIERGFNIRSIARN